MDNVLPVNVPDSCEEGGGGAGGAGGAGGRGRLCATKTTSTPQLLSLHTGH